jgi:hypothetical protein
MKINHEIQIAILERNFQRSSYVSTVNRRLDTSSYFSVKLIDVVSELYSLVHIKLRHDRRKGAWEFFLESGGINVAPLEEHSRLTPHICARGRDFSL